MMHTISPYSTCSSYIETDPARACHIGIIVTEQEVARGPITGRYTVETQDMREPLFVRWHAQHGRVQNRSARLTAIAFDLSGTRAGQMWTAVITAQVTDAETCDTIIKGTFVQIRVVDA